VSEFLLEASNLPFPYMSSEKMAKNHPKCCQPAKISEGLYQINGADKDCSRFPTPFTVSYCALTPLVRWQMGIPACKNVMVPFILHGSLLEQVEEKTTGNLQT